MDGTPRYRGVIFDLDQTLANTEDFTMRESCEKNCQQYAEWHLYEFLEPHLKIISWENFQKTYANAKREVKQILKGTAASHNRYLYIQRALEILGARFSPRLVLEATDIYWDFIIKSMTLFPTVKETLKSIKETHLKTAILSDLTADIQIRKLAKLGIDKYIDLLVTSEEAKADKPDNRPFKLALRKMDLQNNEVLMVGNNPKTDIAGAKKANIDHVLFDFNNSHSEYPGEKISRFSDLLSIIGVGYIRYTDDRLVIWDLIGTLTDEPHLVRKTLASVLRANGISTDYPKVKAAYEKLKIGAISDSEFWNSIGIPEAKHKYFEDELINAIKLRQGAVDAVSRIRKQHKTAILSNIPSTWGKRIVEKFSLDKIFDAIVFSGDHGTKKPDPELFKIVLSNFTDISPSRVYIVDNELDDLNAARHHIMNTIWLQVGEYEPDYVPDHVVSDVQEVAEII